MWRGDRGRLAAAASAPESDVGPAPRDAGTGPDQTDRGTRMAEAGGTTRAAAINGSLGRLVLAGAWLGALVLIVAEFMTLYQAHLASRSTPIQSVAAGSHNSYAMIPVALLAAALAIAAWRTASRPAVLAIGLLGVVALLIALVGDLPDAHAVGLADNNSVSATTTPNAGLYVETFGAILLIATSGLGFTLLGLPGWTIRPRGKSRTERK